MAQATSPVNHRERRVIRLFTLILIALILAATAAKARAADPARMVEHGSAVLVWLERHPKPGTPRSRARVAARGRHKVWRGLRLAGVLPGFTCIHEHEGAWTSNTGNGYWGGLQEDWQFFHTYGREYVPLWGTPDRWPVWAQLVSGYRAWQVRGWSPWGTRGMCGL